MDLHFCVSMCGWKGWSVNRLMKSYPPFPFFILKSYMVKSSSSSFQTAVWAVLSCDISSWNHLPIVQLLDRMDNSPMLSCLNADCVRKHHSIPFLWSDICMWPTLNPHHAVHKLQSWLFNPRTNTVKLMLHNYTGQYSLYVYYIRGRLKHPPSGYHDVSNPLFE